MTEDRGLETEDWGPRAEDRDAFVPRLPSPVFCRFSTSHPPRLMKSKYRYLPPILWAAFIFIASSNPDPTGVLPEEAVTSMKAIRVLGVRLDNLVWAASHILLYAVLAYLLARAMNFQAPFSFRKLGLILGLSTLYGLSDEIHQIFVPGRGFELVDLLMDSIGALLGLGIYALFRIRKARKAQKNALLL